MRDQRRDGASSRVVVKKTKGEMGPPPGLWLRDQRRDGASSRVVEESWGLLQGCG